MRPLVFQPRGLRRGGGQSRRRGRSAGRSRGLSFYHFLSKAFSEPVLAEARPKPDLHPGRKDNLADIDRSIDAVDLDCGGHIECSISTSGR
jgi:hypothetical protein